MDSGLLVSSALADRLGRHLDTAGSSTGTAARLGAQIELATARNADLEKRVTHIRAAGDIRLDELASQTRAPLARLEEQHARGETISWTA